MDGHTGKVVFSRNADSSRYPASLTKIMTLYLVFEELEAKRLSLGTQMRVSRRAQGQAPSKLGLRQGQTIRVEDAILALVTKSANDVATVVAEHIGGTEVNFARMMTAKARDLGMNRTRFMNASGLPNARQTTTARDMARLGKRIREDFPQYYYYFSTTTFSWKGRTYGNHNNLLGKYTGTVGIKPTYGRVSRYGMIAFASSLDQAGVITRSAEDAARLLGAMSGFDERDSTSIDHPVPDYVGELDASLDGLRIGIVRQHFDAGLDAGCAQAVRDALAVLEQRGAVLTEVDLPNLDYCVPTYYVVAPAECSSNLSRFDGVRFGYRAENPEDLLDLYCRSRGEGFGAEVKRRIMTGTYVLSAGYYDAYYLQAQKVRQLISEDFRRAFADVDLIAGPTTPTPAFKLGDKTDDPITMYLNDIYTIGANLAGLPALSAPCGMVDELPVGLHLVGPHWSEGRLLAATHQYQQDTAWHEAAPEAFR